MEPAQLPLILAAHFTSTGPETFPLDRVRMQKAVFLLSQRGSGELHDLYTYRPYNWGPYSDDLAHDVRVLHAAGRITVLEAHGSRYGRYVATDIGNAEAVEPWNRLDQAQRAFVADVRRYVTASSFQKLLREIYAAYPQFATASQFRG